MNDSNTSHVIPTLESRLHCECDFLHAHFSASRPNSATALDTAICFVGRRVGVAD